jgi:hypothetical protein
VRVYFRLCWPGEEVKRKAPRKGCFFYAQVCPTMPAHAKRCERIRSDTNVYEAIRTYTKNTNYNYSCSCNSNSSCSVNPSSKASPRTEMRPGRTGGAGGAPAARLFYQRQRQSRPRRAGRLTGSLNTYGTAGRRTRHG